MFKRIISFCVAFAMVFSFTLNASAEDISSQTTTNFWNALVHAGMNAADIADASMVGALLSYLSADTCPASDDGWHHAESGTSNGDSLTCVCRYCSSTFVVDSAGISDAYNDYVSDLQTDLGTSMIDSDGCLIFPYPIAYLSGYVANLPIYGPFYGGWSGTIINNDLSRKTFNVNFYDSSMTLPTAPVYGVYSAGYTSNREVGTCGIMRENVSCEPGQTMYFFTGSTYDWYLISGIDANTSVNFSIYPYIRLSPSVSISESTSQDISANSRPTTLTGDYGIIGDDGSIIKADGNLIVDESSNTVYNPVTNTTYNFTDYAYDYSDRSYNLTLEDGSTMKVVYGDENISISEGDTVYNVYYLIENPDSSGGSGSGSEEDKHTHDYTSEVTKQPNCLLSGVRTYTCSCGESYTKAVPATGHDWQISQQVATTYDPETGEELTTGYTIYTCATCGEQYKSTDGNAPPNGSSGDSSGGLGDVIAGLLGVVGDIIGGLLEGALTLATKALEALSGLGDLFAQMIETIMGFFGGFLDFLSAMFPFLPEETITILNFGLTLMIAAAVFNKFLK